MIVLREPVRFVISIRNLKTYYPIRGSFGARLLGREAGYVKAVDDVSLESAAARWSGSWANREAARRRSGGRCSGSSAPPRAR